MAACTGKGKRLLTPRPGDKRIALTGHKYRWNIIPSQERQEMGIKLPILIFLL